jgi:hypothetical protein
MEGHRHPLVHPPSPPTHTHHLRAQRPASAAWACGRCPMSRLARKSRSTTGQRPAQVGTHACTHAVVGGHSGIARVLSVCLRGCARTRLIRPQRRPTDCELDHHACMQIQHLLLLLLQRQAGAAARALHRHRKGARSAARAGRLGAAAAPLSCWPRAAAVGARTSDGGWSCCGRTTER